MFRLGFPFIAVLTLAAYFLPVRSLDSLIDDAFDTLLVSSGSLYVAIIAFRNRLELHRDALYVWTLARVRRVPTADIVDVRASDNGLDLTLRDGSVVTTWLIGEKIRPQRKRRTRADRLADDVRALL